MRRSLLYVLAGAAMALVIAHLLESKTEPRSNQVAGAQAAVDRPQPRVWSAGPPTSAAPPVRQLSVENSDAPEQLPQIIPSNPVLAVTLAGFTDAAEERQALMDALTESGQPHGEWLTAAQLRLHEVGASVAEDERGSFDELGCWGAGCAGKITFRDVDATVDIEHLADPAHHGAWTAGVVFTEPTKADGGPLSAFIYFVAPEQN